MGKKVTEYFVDVGIHCIWWFAHFLVFAGMILMLHQVLVEYGAIRQILEPWFVEFVGAAFAILALFLVSISIYFEHRPRRPPSMMSRKFSAPIMIILSTGMLAAFLWFGILSRPVIDGLAAIALGGAMMRLTGVPLQFMPKSSN